MAVSIMPPFLVPNQIWWEGKVRVLMQIGSEPVPIRKLQLDLSPCAGSFCNPSSRILPPKRPPYQLFTTHTCHLDADEVGPQSKYRGDASILMPFAPPTSYLGPGRWPVVRKSHIRQGQTTLATTFPYHYWGCE